MNHSTQFSPVEAKVKNKRNVSFFWIFPVIALMMIVRLIWERYEDRGIKITIDFQSAEGIIEGRTPIRFQGVEVGTVQEIILSRDMNKIQILASIKHSMKEALRSKTQFWLVTPKASMEGLSGLDALVSGNYIGMIPGKGELQNHFTALNTQPKYRINNGDLLIHLYSPELGSLSISSLVYFRKIPVGRVYDYTITPDKQEVVIDVIIEKRFAWLVKKDSHFWNVSGINANVNLSGAKIKLESLSALVNGAIAFDSLNNSDPASSDDKFLLYEDLAHSHRGVIVKLAIPTGDNLKVGSTSLVYQGLEVGKLTKLKLDSRGSLIGEMIVDPSILTLLREKTYIKLHNTKLSLNYTSINRLLTGDILELIPGEGKPCSSFIVVPEDKVIMQKPDVLTIKLNASESYGIDVGSPITLHGMQIGQVSERKLIEKGVVFFIAIDHLYQNMLHSDSKFVANSQMDVKIDYNGIELIGASANEWMNGGIRVIPGTKGKIKECYSLYDNFKQAIENSIKNLPTMTLVFKEKELPDIQTGSIVLYRKFEVGKVTSIRPQDDIFNIDLYIFPEYQNLLSKRSVFWAESSTRIQLNSNGLIIQGSPISRAIQGAISFDNLTYPDTRQMKNEKRILYSSEVAARAVGNQITLCAFDSDINKLAVGMPIRYLGIDIGYIQNLKLITNNKTVQANVIVNSEYAKIFSRSGSKFSIIKPHISIFGIEHLDTIFKPYIDAKPGQGKECYNFFVHDNAVINSRYLEGLKIILEVPEVGSFKIGTPVFFRGVEVGVVTDLTISNLSDYVMVTLYISNQYQHLVRNNSIFWIASGYSFDFGLTGGFIKTGSFSQFIRGGIYFITPPSRVLFPKANSGKHFILQKTAPKRWCEWSTMLPK